MNIKDNIYNEIIRLDGKNINVIDILDKNYFVEHIIICTSKSKQHAKYIYYNILKKFNKNFNFIEKDILFEWIILDLSNIIIHIMQKSSRDFYLIDKLWNF